MTIAAVLCIAIGVYPQALYSLLPFDTGYNPYDATHVLTQTQLLFFSALAFVWLNLKKMYPPELPSVNLDIDWFYRRLFPAILTPFFNMFWAIDRAVRGVFMRGVNGVLGIISRHEPDGILSRTQLSGSMVIWVSMLLAVFLILSFW